MRPQYRDKKQRVTRTRTIRIIVGCVCFIVITLTGAFLWMSPVLVRLGVPVWRAQSAATDALASQAYRIRTKASVFNENEALTKENTDLKTSMLDYQVLKDENTQLKDLMGRIDPKHAFTLAVILAKPSRSPYDTIIIDGGSEASMIEGQDVYANATIPIGQISKVYTTSALVTLYSSPDQTTDGQLEGSNTNVELIGRGGGNFEMSVPIDVLTDKGTAVVSPHLSTEILAFVQDIISLPTDPIKKVILSSPVNIQNLKWVEVKKY